MLKKTFWFLVCCWLGLGFLGAIAFLVIILRS